MIDVQRPNISFASPKKTPVGKYTLIARIVLLVIVVGAVAFGAWIFLRTTRTIDLSEGGSIEFKGYSVTVDRITKTCPDTTPNCSDAAKLLGAQLRIHEVKSTGISYEYLEAGVRTHVEDGNFAVDLQKVSADAKTVSLKLSVK